MTMPAQPTQPSHRPRRIALIIIGVVLTVVVGLGVLLAITHGPAPSPALDRTDPAAVGAEFLRRYASGDPAVCDLATVDLHSQLAREGRCTATTATGTASTVTTLFSKACGDRAGLQAQVAPAGRLTKPFAVVTLAVLSQQWAVTAVTPIEDRAALRPYACAAAGG